MVDICLQNGIELLIMPEPPDHLFTGTTYASEDMVGAYATLMDAGIIGDGVDVLSENEELEETLSIKESWEWAGSLNYCMHGRKWEDCPECDRREV